MVNQELKVPSFEIIQYIPNNFFNKDINEPFIKDVMECFLLNNNWIKGDPNKNEPDYFCEGIPYEFTIASDKNKDNLITRLKSGTYTSNDVERDLIGYIKTQIESKAKKQYSVGNVNLCILCMLERFDWVSDTYGSIYHSIIYSPFEDFINSIKKEYIDIKFANIYIIFPDPIAKWWVWDLKSNRRVGFQLTDEQIKSKDYPFYAYKEVFNKFITMF